jgi:phage N-6-adenine-methyltransferase
MDVHYSSKTDLWETPADLFETIKADYNPTLDVCAIPENAKCDRYFTPEQDGLSQEWEGVCWMNPPYGRAIGKWVKKAYEASQRGATVVCLLPARTDTAWWHDYVMRGRIKFLRGRLKFGGGKNSAPFPSAIVVFDPYITALNVASDMQEDELADIRYMIEGVFVA